MQEEITSSLGVCLGAEKFSVDELVLKLKELFEGRAFGEILAHILMLADATIKISVLTGKDAPVACECGHRRFSLNGWQGRTLHTGLGDVRLERICRLKCASCGKTHTALLRLLGVEAFQTKTSELERTVAENVAANSYRRARETVSSLSGVRVGHTTFHNWVLETGSDEIEVPEKVAGSLPATIVADGTGCKAAGGKKGDIKAMIGMDANANVFPIGAWTRGEEWKEIGRSLKEGRVKFPDGTLLVCDGEPGLAESFADFAKDVQRCHWHIVRDVHHAMWRDGGRLEQARPVQDALKAVLAVELPGGEFEKVSEEEKDDIEERMEKAGGYIDRVIGYLRGRNYVTAANYLERAKGGMFCYVRRWLALGIACPRASSIIERVMRELGRRIKKLGYNWKEEGVGKVARIILKIFTRPQDWEEYWRKKMNISQTVSLTFRIVKS